MYGLLGKSLKHSFSKPIHEAIRPMEYWLMETENPALTLMSMRFTGVNVTHPYKRALVDACAIKDANVKATGVLNTIVNENGLWHAYNTDVNAFQSLVQKAFPHDLKSSIGILGNGATMASIHYALTALGYTDITVYARNPKAGERPIDALDNSHTILINATPVGTTPDCEATLVEDFTPHTALKLVVDVVYNPIKTRFMQRAEEAGIRAIGGLYMLVAQAIESNQRFFKTTYDPNLTEQVYTSILKNTLNIAFIGLPFSGKSHLGRMLAERLSMVFVDIDKQVEKAVGSSVESFIETEGIDAFRAIEHTIAKKTAKARHTVIATGGGLVENNEAMKALKQHACVVFIDLADSLMDGIRFHSRPHVKTKDDLLRLKAKRQSHYERFADITIMKSSQDADKALAEIEVKFHAYLNHQWSQLELARDA